MRSYKIARFGAPLEEFVEPTPRPAGSEVLLRVAACGVCHSDIHLWEGYFDLGGGARIDVAERGIELPFTLGHEVAGEVVALGPDAAGVAVGDQRLVYTWIGCGDCPVCAAGDENLCDNPRFIGTRVPGGYSDHLLVPHPRYLLDHTGIRPELACLYACSGVTVYSAINKVLPLAAGDRLLLIGCGGLGLMAVRIAATLTGAEIIAADVDELKLAAARAAGAHHTVNASVDGAAGLVRELTGRGAAAAIDFVGNPRSAQLGIDSLCRGGSLVVVGLFGGSLPMALPLFPFRALTVRGSYVGNLRETRALLELAAAGEVAPVPVQTRPLEQAPAALADLRAGRVVGRVVLTP